MSQYWAHSDIERMDVIARSRLRTLGLVALATALPACRCGEVLVDIPGALRGQACDVDTGKPLTSVTLTLEADGQMFDVLTSTDGSFRFQQIATGPVTLHLPAGAQGGAARSEELVVDTGKATLFTDSACRALPLAPLTGAVDGQICNRHTGSLVSDAEVTVTAAAFVWRTRTDAEGRFLLADLPRGEHVLSVVGEGFTRAFLLEVAVGSTTHLELGEDCTETFASQGTLSGALCDVTDPTNPLVGATVSAVDSSGNTVSDVTDTDGRFFLNALAAGPASVRIARAPDVNNIYGLDVIAGEDRVVVRQLCGEEPPPPPPPGFGDIAIDPPLHDFGVLEVNQTGAIEVAIRNEGQAPLLVSGVSYSTLSLELALDTNEAVNGALPWTLAPGAAVTVVVDYAPSDGVADSGTITVVSNDVDEPSITATQGGNGRTFPGFSTGWYIVDEHTNYQTTSNPAHTVEYHGDLDGYWYEPSGVHGLIGSVNRTADFQVLHDYVMARAGAPTPVTGPLTFNASSTVPALTSASYSYILCDFWIEAGDDPSLYEIATGEVDDGILVLVNGEMLGNLLVRESGSWTLDNAVPGAVNSLLIILMDNAANHKGIEDLTFYRDGVMVTGD